MCLFYYWHEKLAIAYKAWLCMDWVNVAAVPLRNANWRLKTAQRAMGVQASVSRYTTSKANYISIIWCTISNTTTFQKVFYWNTRNTNTKILQKKMYHYLSVYWSCCRGWFLLLCGVLSNHCLLVFLCSEVRSNWQTLVWPGFTIQRKGKPRVFDIFVFECAQ